MIVRVVLSIIFLPILGYGQMMDDLREPRELLGVYPQDVVWEPPIEYVNILYGKGSTVFVKPTCDSIRKDEPIQVYSEYFDSLGVEWRRLYMLEKVIIFERPVHEEIKPKQYRVPWRK
jgi:hypothetical protein